MEHPPKINSYIFLDEAEEYKNTDTLPIRILDEPFKNVEFRFQRVSFDTIGDNLKINFDMEIMKTPKNKDIDVNNQEFVDFVGEILYDIIVNRKDIDMTTAYDPSEVDVADLEDDVHQEPYGKDHS